MLPEVKAVVLIPLTQGKVAVIDFDDFEKVRPYKWFAHKNRRNWYACTSGKRIAGKQRPLKLHRVIMGASSGELLDHIDGDGLNNRRCNLRVVTAMQNGQNRKRNLRASSPYKGVSWYKPNLKWVAQIRLNKRGIHIGYFKREEDAARAYDKKARELFGEWASPNFPI